MCLPAKLADGRMSIKKEKKFLVLNVQHLSFSQDAEKTFSLR